MADEQRPQSDRDQDERFEDALDDLFGPDTSEPEQEPVAPTSASAPPSMAAWPTPASAAEPTHPKRSVARTAVIGCAVIVAVLFICLVAQFVFFSLFISQDSSVDAQGLLPF